MIFEVRSKLLTDLQLKVSGLPKNISTRSILRQAVQPTLQAARQYAPVGKPRKLTKREQSKPLTYERGGRLKKDLRVKVVSDKMGEVTALIGVSRRASKVGWRANFPEFGTPKMNAKPFIRPAGTSTQSSVQSRFTAMVGKRASEHLR